MRERRGWDRATVLLGLLALASGAVLALAGRRPGPPPAPAGRGLTPAPVPPRRPAASFAGPAGAPPRRCRVQAQAAPALVVRVVDGASGIAVAGAEVRAGAAPPSALASSLPGTAWQLATGPVMRSGPNGLVLLPPAACGRVVWARASGQPGGARFGWLRVAAGENAGVLRLPLRPDWSPCVRVVDGRGRPCAGVPLQLLAHGAGLRSAHSDRAGRWQLAHLGVLAARWHGLSARLGFPGGENVSVPLGDAAREVVLVLPPCGRLVVRAATRAVRGRLQALSIRDLRRGPPVEVALEVGPAPCVQEVWPVAVGAELVVRVEEAGAGAAPLRAPAPSFAGERCEWTLPVR